MNNLHSMPVLSGLTAGFAAHTGSEFPTSIKIIRKMFLVEFPFLADSNLCQADMKTSIFVVMTNFSDCNYKHSSVGFCV